MQYEVYMSDRALLDNYSESRPELLDEAVKYAQRFKMQWNDLANLDNCFPEKKEFVLDLIKRYIGYMPDRSLCLKHEPFLRAAAAYGEKGLITQDQELDEIDFHLKQIRNADIQTGGWNWNRAFSSEDYARYDSYLPHLKVQARERLIFLTGIEPEVENSLEAELFLRDCFTMEEFYPTMPVGSIADYKAATILFYRSEFFRGGQEASDNLLLIGWHYEIVKLKQTDPDIFKEP